MRCALVLLEKCILRMPRQTAATLEDLFRSQLDVYKSNRIVAEAEAEEVA